MKVLNEVLGRHLMKRNFIIVSSTINVYRASAGVRA